MRGEIRNSRGVSCDWVLIARPGPPVHDWVFFSVLFPPFSFPFFLPPPSSLVALPFSLHAPGPKVLSHLVWLAEGDEFKRWAVGRCFASALGGGAGLVRRCGPEAR